METPLKALLLAAGLGTRLRPLTLKKPKCLMEINNKPLLEHWLKKLEDLSVKEVIINTHYLRDQVIDFIKARNNSHIEINEFYEEHLLGTAGTLLQNLEFFKGSTGLLIHADNFTKIDLSGLIEAHFKRPSDCLITMLTFNSSNPESCGVVEINENNIVTKFHEKVDNPPSNRANGAIYVFDDIFIKWLFDRKTKPNDFSTQVLPLMIGKIYTWHIEDDYFDIGTKSSLEKAQLI